MVWNREGRRLEKIHWLLPATSAFVVVTIGVATQWAGAQQVDGIRSEMTSVQCEFGRPPRGHRDLFAAWP